MLNVDSLLKDILTTDSRIGSKVERMNRGRAEYHLQCNQVRPPAQSESLWSPLRVAVFSDFKRSVLLLG